MGPRTAGAVGRSIDSAAGRVREREPPPAKLRSMIQTTQAFLLRLNQGDLSPYMGPDAETKSIRSQARSMRRTLLPQILGLSRRLEAGWGAREISHRVACSAGNKLVALSEKPIDESSGAIAGIGHQHPRALALALTLARALALALPLYGDRTEQRGQAYRALFRYRGC